MKAYLGLGSNLGDRKANLQKAVDSLGKSVEITKQSSVYKTEPIGYKGQADFLNMVIEIETNLSADELLKIAKEIEKIIGRTQTFKNGPREIDIDILLYDKIEIKSDKLVLPHPRLTEREFVLKPLLEIAPDLEMPDGKKLKEIKLTENQQVEKI